MNARFLPAIEAKDGSWGRSDSEHDESSRGRPRRSDTPEREATEDVEGIRTGPDGRAGARMSDDGLFARANFIGGNTKDVLDGEVDR